MRIPADYQCRANWGREKPSAGEGRELGFQPWQRDEAQKAGRSRVLLAKEVLEPSVTGESPALSPDFNTESLSKGSFSPSHRALYS